VLTQLTETGELDTSRVFTQLKVAGDGPVEVVLPNQSTRGLRNLEGLGSPNTDGDSVIYGIDATPSGVFERTVANHTADLPVSMEVEYELDGETLENPRDLVGRSGELKVTYKLRNETVEEQELDIFNARQEPTTETVEVGVPLVGTLSLPLDNRFTDVRADGANLVGDGRGNTIVNWSLVLFEPLGFFEQEVSWTAQVTDAMVPPANAQIAPVSSDSFPSLPNAQSAYADTFAGLQTITDGAVRIDMTLVAILDGAGQLLDGMNQLADGSGELAAASCGQPTAPVTSPTARARHRQARRSLRPGSGRLHPVQESLPEEPGSFAPEPVPSRAASVNWRMARASSLQGSRTRLPVLRSSTRRSREFAPGWAHPMSRRPSLEDCRLCALRWGVRSSTG
jgi:X-X-X-Leu-X-X-Gly heptad repeat protein